MRRAAWINQVLAAWLLGFVVLGLPDSAAAVEIGAHGVVALLLLIASWRVLAQRLDSRVPAWLQIAAGLALLTMIPAFHYQVRWFVGLNDLIVGAAATIDGVIEALLCPAETAPIAPV